jgi:acyl-CoA thioesterase I
MTLPSLRLPVALIVVLAGCDGPERVPVAARRDTTASGTRPRVVFIGTSLTAGYGLPDIRLAYPALIQRRLEAAGLRYEVVNAGVSGATSADARRSIDWILGRPVDVLVIETGANDGLRGLDVDSLRANIQAMIDRARRQAPPPRIVLVGMEAPPNYGADYARRFRAVYPELAQANGAALVPFLLEGVAGVDSLNQGDGIHPTAAAERLLADNVWRVLGPMLR